ncbi:MAG: TetR/AcrR family transcriptional regulator [Pseudomonadales bacterium]
MPESSQRTDLIQRLGQVFRDRGYEGATLTQLAAASGLSKASLYHHFPGGKAEMADVLVRDAVAQAERLAFARLRGPEPAEQRLQRFVEGFADYLERSGGLCLLGVLALGSARPTLGETISTQFLDWQDRLTAVFEAGGHKPKGAARRAGELLNVLYGAQMVSALTDDRRHLNRSLKRLARLQT